MMRPVAWRRMETTALFLVLLLLSARLLISATYQHTLQSPKSPLLYHAGRYRSLDGGRIDTHVGVPEFW